MTVFRLLAQTKKVNQLNIMNNIIGTITAILLTISILLY